MGNGTSTNIEKLVEQLASRDVLKRMRARESLVKVGAKAVPSICRLADSENNEMRWECAKTLAEIADPKSIHTLIRLLEDPKEGTRWDAAVGLINVGSQAVEPVLRAIIERSTDYTIIDGAHACDARVLEEALGGIPEARLRSSEKYVGA